MERLEEQRWPFVAALMCRCYSRAGREPVNHARSRTGSSLPPTLQSRMRAALPRGATAQQPPSGWVPVQQQQALSVSTGRPIAM